MASGSSIYKRFTNSELLNTVLPDTKESRSNIKNDSRLLPIQSTIRDVQRIRSYILSDRGKLFIGKQLLLQTGNVFAETRLYNPLSPILNAVPTLHVVRQFGRPIYNILTPTREYRGGLQKETIDSFSSPVGNPLARVVSQLANTITSPIKALFVKPATTDYFDSELDEFYVRPEDSNGWYPRLLNPQIVSDRGKIYTNKFYADGYSNDYSNKLFAVNKPQPANFTGQLEIYRNRLLRVIAPPKFRLTKGSVVPFSYMSWISNRKLSVFGSKFIKPTNEDSAFFGKPYTIFSTGAPTTEDEAQVEIASIHTMGNAFDAYRLTYLNQPGKFHASFAALENLNNGNGYFYGNVGFNPSPEADNGAVLRQRKPNIGDSFNPYISVEYANKIVDAEQVKNLNVPRVDYTSLYKAAPEPNKSVSELLGKSGDIIRFIFTNTADNKRMHFRGFISTIKEQVKPEFNEQRFLGRTERYVNYGGAKRTATLEFTIVAFSKLELDAMWARINYLTGLAFPRGVSNSGFMIPPLFKITVGDIYEEQPCYIDTLDYVMLDESITFDVDKEVSQVINVTLSLVLLEKRTRYYDSPFYGVMEKLIKQNSGSFAKPLEVVPIDTTAIDEQLRTLQKNEEVGWNFVLDGGAARLFSESLKINFNTPQAIEARNAALRTAGADSLNNARIRDAQAQEFTQARVAGARFFNTLQSTGAPPDVFEQARVDADYEKVLELLDSTYNINTGRGRYYVNADDLPTGQIFYPVPKETVCRDLIDSGINYDCDAFYYNRYLPQFPNQGNSVRPTTGPYAPNNTPYSSVLPSGVDPFIGFGR